VRREYPNGIVKALRYAVGSRYDFFDRELLDAADEIERLKAELRSQYEL
jgi:hypothetical protein